jgi:hypothetical protein
VGRKIVAGVMAEILRIIANPVTTVTKLLRQKFHDFRGLKLTH